MPLCLSIISQIQYQKYKHLGKIDILSTSKLKACAIDTINKVKRQPMKWEKIFANLNEIGVNIHTI